MKLETFCYNKNEMYHFVVNVNQNQLLKYLEEKKKK